MAYTQKRVIPWSEVFGADGEKIFAVGSKLRESLQILNAPAGSNQLTGSVVPSNELWIVQMVNTVDTGHATTLQEQSVFDGVQQILFNAATNPGAYVWIIWSGQIVLFPADRMLFNFYGVTLGDNLYARYTGYKMTIP